MRRSGSESRWGMCAFASCKQAAHGLWGVGALLAAAGQREQVGALRWHAFSVWGCAALLESGFSNGQLGAPSLALAPAQGCCSL